MVSAGLQRAKRMDQRIVCFARTLSTKVRVLTPMPLDSKAINPFADVYRPHDAGKFYVQSMPTLTNSTCSGNFRCRPISKKRSLWISHTKKRIAVDEVDSKLDFAEHQVVQRHGGDDGAKWRTALMEAEGVEETARRAAVRKAT